MKRNGRLMVLIVLALFLMPLVVNADSLERFAENPIPYWDDDSLDVALSWDSIDQTVTVEDDTPYWEDMSDVSDWNAINNPITSDGELATITVHDDYVWDRWDCNTPSDSWFEKYLTIRWKANVTATVKFLLYFTAGDDYGMPLVESVTVLNGASSTDWDTMNVLLNNNVTSDDIEGLSFLMKSYSHVAIEIDYILVGEQELDIEVPIEQQPIQSIELMGNFSALKSTVRFQMYDNTTASGLFCDVNSTQVTFPDATYAEFTDFARINFSLDEERLIFRIEVSAQNTTLINYYSFYEGLANKDYLRMNDSVFEGSYTLWYLQGDIGYFAEVIDTDNIFYLLFLSTEMWGYLGPMAMIVIGYVLTKKEKFLGVLWFAVECLFVSQYLILVGAMPDYWWHIFILLIGGLFTCVYPLLNR